MVACTWTCARPFRTSHSVEFILNSWKVHAVWHALYNPETVKHSNFKTSELKTIYQKVSIKFKCFLTDVSEINRLFWLVFNIVTFLWFVWKCDILILPCYVNRAAASNNSDNGSEEWIRHEKNSHALLLITLLGVWKGIYSTNMWRKHTHS